MCVVGSSEDDDLGSASGSAYLYKIETGWVPFLRFIKKLTALDGEYQDYFGTGVATDGRNVIVGAPAKFKDLAIGTAYVYDLTCPSADLTGDCFVGLGDFAILAAQWLDGIAPFEGIP